MSCPSLVYIGDPLAFSVCTHDPETSNSSPADQSPEYRIYERLDENPVLVGTMQPMDILNTSGFYAAEVDCTADNGFVHGHTYTIYISAEVNNNPGSISFGFTAVERLASAAALAEVDNVLDAIYTYLYGDGPITFVYTVYDSRDGTTPLANVRVRVTTDVRGRNFVCENYTDAFGEVTFHLSAGTYYFWRYRHNTQFNDNPDTEVVG